MIYEIPPFDKACDTCDPEITYPCDCHYVDCSKCIALLAYEDLLSLGDIQPIKSYLEGHDYDTHTT